MLRSAWSSARTRNTQARFTAPRGAASDMPVFWYLSQRQDKRVSARANALQDCDCSLLSSFGDRLVGTNLWGITLYGASSCGSGRLGSEH